jgi:hypothetical protein
LIEDALTIPGTFQKDEVELTAEPAWIGGTVKSAGAGGKLEASENLKPTGGNWS